MLSNELETTGKWQRWAEADPGIDWPHCLEAAAQGWRHEGADAFLLVAVLTRRASWRGGDDNDAALAVVVLLEPGIRRLAGELEDLCGVDDVCAAVWEEVKNAEPQLECRAPWFLLRRAKQRLLRPAAGFIGLKAPTVSLEAVLELGEPSSYDGGDTRHELRDLLEWARASGVLEGPETEFLVEITDLSRVVDEGAAAHELSVRHGVTPRTIRRRRAEAVRRLRDAVPDYLAATA